MACQHAEKKPGPRYPMRWGSATTEVCKGCDAYRLLLHGVGPWLPGPIADAIKRAKEED